MSQVEIELPERQPERPSNRRVLFVSVAAFSLLVLLGAGIGLLVGPGGDSELAASATLSVAVEDEVLEAEDVIDEPDVDAAAIEPEPVSTTPSVAPTTTTAAPEATTAAPTTAAPSTTSPPSSTTAAPETSTTTPTTENPQPVAFLELTKAVQDRLELTVGDEVLVNVITNDKGTDGDASIELTGLGELAPGFLLQSNGTLRGTAEVCGRWQAQYALSSENFGTSTSWIDVVVSGC